MFAPSLTVPHFKILNSHAIPSGRCPCRRRRVITTADVDANRSLPLALLIKTTRFYQKPTLTPFLPVLLLLLQPPFPPLHGGSAYETRRWESYGGDGDKALITDVTSTIDHPSPPPHAVPLPNDGALFVTSSSVNYIIIIIIITCIFLLQTSSTYCTRT